MTHAPLKPQYRGESSLRSWVTKVVKGYLADKLGPQDLPYDVWQRSSLEKQSLYPLPIFGTAFAPDLAIDVAEKPALAILATLVKDEPTLASRVGSAIGQAIVLSHQYPAVVSFVLLKVRQEEYQHWLAREIQLDLWSNHKVKLVLRDQSISATPNES
ncbi:MAG: hypothetical protein ACE5JL_18350 [Dehalococcoidia bacterium]